MRPDDHQALRLLAGCPTGATRDALALHGIAIATLRRLARHDLVRGIVQTTTTELRIERYSITEAGHRKLETR